MTTEEQDARIGETVPAPPERATAPTVRDDARRPKIYGFVNGGSPGWYDVCAIAEDGASLASHICSHPAYGPHDIGVTSNWKHECYALYYPNGYDVEWVDADALPTHAGLQAAFAAHREMSPEEHMAKVAHVTAELEARRAKAEGCA